VKIVKDSDIVLATGQEFPYSHDLAAIIATNNAKAINVTGVNDLEVADIDDLPVATSFQEGHTYVIVANPTDEKTIEQQFAYHINYDLQNARAPVFWITDWLDLRFKEVVTSRNNIIIHKIRFEADALVVESVHEPPDIVSIWYKDLIEVMRESFELKLLEKIATESYMRNLTIKL
jgi:hypothetical protein